MKKSVVIIASLALFAVLTVPALAEESGIPFGVSPKEVAVSGTMDFPEPHMLGLSKGKLLQSYEYKVGNRTGVKLSGLEYTLRFWNVGEMGGTSGFLFWKKDFGKATLHLEYVVDAPGQIITDVNDTPMGPAYQMEPADDIPAVDGASCSLRFTGGPAGTFKGTCGNGAIVEGRIGGAGAFAVFERIVQPDDPKESDLALSLFQNNEMQLSGQFGDWKFDASQLEDSGARFSSLNGEINVRHDNDRNWVFAKMGMPLYVLDHVKTEEDSTAILSFTDMSTFLVRPETEIVVTTPPKKDSKIRLVAGNIWVNVKKMLKDGTMEVEMSQAVAGIKGTRFILSDNGSESKIEVTEGTVSFRAKSDGKEVMVSAGESVTASTAGLSEKSSFDASSRDTELVKVTPTLEESSVITKESLATANNGIQLKVLPKSNYTRLVVGLGVLGAVVILVFLRRRLKGI